MVASILTAACATACSDPDYNSEWAKASIMKKGAEDALRHAAYDPNTLEFRNFRFDVKSGVTCGEFNANNRLGGKAGFKSFVFTPTGVGVEGQDTKQFAELYPKCGMAVAQGDLPGAP